MKHFYDTAHWREGTGHLLWQSRRMFATILALTEDDPTLPAPHIAPLVDYYRSTAWRGFYATWYADGGGEMNVYVRGDSLEIWAENADGVTLFQHNLSNAEAGKGNPAHPYRRYNAERLSHAIGAGKRWLTANRANLGTIDDSIDHLFFGAAASPQEKAWDEEWGGYKHEDKMWGIRQLFCLGQAVRSAGVEMPFFSYIGHHDEDEPLDEYSEMILEWSHTGDGHQSASIEFYADGDIMLYGCEDVMSKEGYKLATVFGTADREAIPLTKKDLHIAIDSLRTWLPTALPDRKTDSRLFFECGLQYNTQLDDWENFFPHRQQVTQPV